jgi:hypothetical protein
MHHLTSLLNAHALTAAASNAVEHSDTSLAIAILIVSLIVLVVVLAIFALLIASFWRIFVKAGQPGWASVVPVYGSVKLLEIVNKPLWWILLLFIPIVNLPISVIVAYRVARVFGKGGWFTTGLVLLPFIFYPILAFGSAQYLNTFPPARATTEAVKWSLIGGGALFFAEMLFILVALTPQPAMLQIMYTDSSGYNYATDGQYVYFNDAAIYGADPSTFKMDGDSYATDIGAVYYDGTAIDGANPYTFTVFKDTLYAKDDQHVYGDGSIIDGADPSTFHVLDSYYAKDHGHVYYQGSEIAQADVATFEQLGKEEGYAKDIDHVYYVGDVFKGADVKTFVVESGTLGQNDYDAKDKNHYYNYGDIVK